MRTAFIEALCEAAAANPRLWLVTGDLGYSVLERFAERFPARYVNVGVAEQNMIGVAAGLASCGKTVFTYSIGNFAFMRCLEQIRNDVCYHRLNVKVVAVGGGLAYGPQGYTHHAIEDLAMLQALSGMTVLAPGDPAETRLLTHAAAAWDGPCYLRLGRAGEPKVHEVDPPLRIGQALVARAGTDVTLVSTGGMLKTTMEAAALLHERGVECRVLSMHTLRPLDTAALSQAASQTRLLATVEEHVPTGGLHGAVLAAIGDGRVPIVPFAIGVDLRHEVGSREYLLGRCGLTAEAISGSVLERWRSSRRSERAGHRIAP